MSFLSMMEAKLPPGFRFHPRDEELISSYLAGKVSGHRNGFPASMIDVDLNKCEPWDLPEMARVDGKQWYFYSLRDRKYASGPRTNRMTASGYWKATGRDRPVVDPSQGGLMGMRKTLIFYRGRAPKGRKTDWVMHEFRLEGSAASTSFSCKEDWVLCRVFHKSRGLPSNASKENSHDDAGPSSLLHLMDTFISFEQAQLSLKGCQPAPCSSSHPPGQQPQWWSSSAARHASPTEGNTPEMAKSFTHPGGLPDVHSYLNPLSYKEKAILDHFPELDGNLRIGESSGSCFSKT